MASIRVHPPLEEEQMTLDVEDPLSEYNLLPPSESSLRNQRYLFRHNTEQVRTVVAKRLLSYILYNFHLLIACILLHYVALQVIPDARDFSFSVNTILNANFIFHLF